MVDLSTILTLSTLGPTNTNSDEAAQAYKARMGIKGDIILCTTVEDSFDCLLQGRADACVVCSLYPNIHKLYIPNLDKTTVIDVFVNNASMGLYRRPGVLKCSSIAAPITSTVFLKDVPGEVVIATSNAEAARMCRRGEVDAAIATTVSAEVNRLELLKSFGVFAVPYTVFGLRDNRI